MRAVALVLLGGLLAAHVAVASDCLEGASAAQDRVDVAALRDAVAAGCACATASSHHAYVACGRDVVRQAAGTVRRACTITALGRERQSTCGYAVALDPRNRRVPCVRRARAERTVTCTVLRARRCVGDASEERTACAVPAWPYTHCIDAADTNGDLRIAGPADSGRCALAQRTFDVASAARPAATPGTPGVVVDNAKLLTQFGGASIDLDRARYTRWHFAGPERTPDAILILIPGLEGGAGGFKILAENLLPRALADHGLVVELWGYDRRTDQLEDRRGLDVAEALGDPSVALDWLYGDDLGLPLGAALDRRAVFYDTHGDIPFIANWTSLVFSRDIDAVVEAARAVTGNVFLGGHSAGTGFTARYAATDFEPTGAGPPDAGYAKLRGLVLLEGGGGSRLGPAPTATQLDRIEARFDGGLFAAVRDNAPRCVDGSTPCTVATELVDCAGLTPPRCTPPATAYTVGFGGLLNPQILASAEPVALQGVRDPDQGQMILQVDQGGVAGNNAIAAVPELAGLGVVPAATAAGATGSLLDEDSPFSAVATFLAASVGAAGPVVDGLLTWLDVTERASFPPCPGPDCVTPDDGPPPVTLPGHAWGQEKEVSRLDRIFEALFAGQTNFTDWYYPSAGLSTTSGIDLDSTALSVGRGRRDIENLTQASAISVPVIAFAASNGALPVTASFLPFAQSIAPCAAPSCDGSPRVVSPTLPNPAFPTFGDVAGGFEVHVNEGYSHLDVITAEDDADNHVVAPLADFIARNVL